MQEIEIIDRLMGITKSWNKTFELLDRHPASDLPAPVIVITPEPEQIEVKAPPIAPPVTETIAEAPKVAVRKKVRKGSLREQILDAIEAYPNVSAADLVNLTGREMDEVSSVSACCKTMLDKKMLVRSKNEKGIYIYRLPQSASH